VQTDIEEEIMGVSNLLKGCIALGLLVAFPSSAKAEWKEGIYCSDISIQCPADAEDELDEQTESDHIGLLDASVRCVRTTDESNADFCDRPFNCSSYSECRLFLTDDRFAAVVGIVDNLAVGVTWWTQWVSPDGSIYSEQSFTNPGPYTSWRWYRSIAIKGYPPSSFPGTWKVQFLIEGSIMSSETFEVREAIREDLDAYEYNEFAYSPFEELIPDVMYQGKIGVSLDFDFYALLPYFQIFKTRYLFVHMFYDIRYTNINENLSLRATYPDPLSSSFPKPCGTP